MLTNVTPSNTPQGSFGLVIKGRAGAMTMKSSMAQVSAGDVCVPPNTPIEWRFTLAGDVVPEACTWSLKATKAQVRLTDVNTRQHALLCPGNTPICQCVHLAAGIGFV